MKLNWYNCSDEQITRLDTEVENVVDWLLNCYPLERYITTISTFRDPLGDYTDRVLISIDREEGVDVRMILD